MWKAALPLGVMLSRNMGYLPISDLAVAIVWAFSGVVAFALSPRDINAAVTAHNLLAWTSAACHLVGAFVLPPIAPATRTHSHFSVSAGKPT